MQVELSYGKGTLPIDLPDTLGITVIRKPVMPVHADPVASVATALNEPICARPCAKRREAHAQRAS